MSNGQYIAISAIAALNTISFCAYAIDKYKAKRNRKRIPEISLLFFSLLGPFGAIPGIWWIRHKTRKVSYLIKFVGLLGLSLLLHAYITYALFID